MRRSMQMIGHTRIYYVRIKKSDAVN